jgi:hypothetical protein
MAVLRELEGDGLFELFGQDNAKTEDLLVARSQMHPSVPLGDVMHM